MLEQAPVQRKEELGRLSPLAMAMRRFWQGTGARIGVCVVVGFILLAVYAPFFASEVAIVWWDEQGLSLPVFADLFNRRSYAQQHDLLFNLLIVLLPLLMTGWYLLGRFASWSVTRRLLSALALVTGSWILCQLPVIPGEQRSQAIWDDRPSSAATHADYRAAQEADRDVTAIFPLIPHRYTATSYSLRRPFEVNEDTGSYFLLGTDDRGHDVFARMIFGARISLTIGLVATVLAKCIGIAIGALSGYSGGVIDLLLQRLVEIMMAFPVFILVLVVVSMLGRDIYIIMIVFGVTGWAGTARLVRGEYLTQMGREYVLAAQSLGLHKSRIMFRHILPNVLTPLLISATFQIAGMILAESGLAFIGLGDPKAPSWGGLLDVGRKNIHYIWLIWVPGIAIFLLVTALNLIGDSLREALDPKGRS